MDHTTAGSGRRRRLLRFGKWLVVVVIGGLVTAELVARFGLGLGNPPLYVADEHIEYLFKPGTYHRFGNRVFINDWSMRSDAIPADKQSADELRVLMLGDSVLNGGAPTDQSALTSEQLQSRLRASLERPVFVMNASAGSWGPANRLAYVERFGLFDADVVVIMLNSEDATDVPTGEPTVGVSPSMPARRPLLALGELATRYRPTIARRLGLGNASSPGEIDPSAATSPGGGSDEEVAALRTSALASLRTLVELTRADDADVIVALHRRRDELADPGDDHRLLRGAADELGTLIVDLGPAFREEVEAGRDPYRDAIHPNARGQTIIADALEPLLHEVLRHRMTVDPSP